MATKSKGLGKGLGTLFGDVASMNSKAEEPKQAPKAEEVPVKAELYVKTRLVEPNRDQPRKEFNESELQELAESIRIHGVIQPLIVTKKGDRYQIVAGERRWRASKLAGLKEIPVIVREYSEQTISEVALIENIQRKDLNPIEEAKAYQKLLQDYGLTQEELSERVTKSRAAIANALRLLKLPEEVQEMLVSGEIQSGHAKVILGLEDEKKELEAAKHIVAEHLSVRETEKYIKNFGKEKAKPAAKKKLRNQVAFDQAEQDLKSKLGTKVTINRKTITSGRIEIEYYSIEDIERILEHIK